MGIASILATAVKGVSWGKVATVAMQYGPDLVRKLKGQIQLRHETADEAEATTDDLYEKIAELHDTILNQQKIIEADNSKIVLLEQSCNRLQSRLNIAISVAAVSVAASLALGIILFTR